MRREMEALFADLLPSLGAAEEVWTGCDSCVPGYTLCPAPPDICGWWSSAPWLDTGFGHFSNTRKCTGREKNKQTETTRGKRRKIFCFFYCLLVQPSISSPTDISQCSDSTA